jgi:hypothetical protein
VTPNRLLAVIVLAVVAAGIAFGASVLAVKSQDPGPVAGHLVIYGP